MSEQNILNPSATSDFNPDFGYSEGLPELRSTFQARSGNIFSRLQQGLGRSYALAWNGRSLATKLALQQWENQYRDDFFSFADWEEGRYFSGRFDGPLRFTPRRNAAWDITGTFVELPGRAMFAYPTNWARDAIFIEERNGDGENLAKLTGTWFSEFTANAHGGSDYYSDTAGDIAEWAYFGYNFRLWSRKQGNLGIIEVTATRVRDGAPLIGPPADIDLYNAASLAAAPVYDSFSNLNFPLDFYRVKLRVTGTKNVASSDFNCYADAIEVMR